MLTTEEKSLISPLVESDSGREPKFAGWQVVGTSFVHHLFFFPWAHQEELAPWWASIQAWFKKNGKEMGGLRGVAVVPVTASEKLKNEELELAREKLFQLIGEIIHFA